MKTRIYAAQAVKGLTRFRQRMYRIAHSVDDSNIERLNYSKLKSVSNADLYTLRSLTCHLSKK